MQFFATTARGLEKALADELLQLGIEAETQQAGVAFTGDIEQAYRACLWSRIASRVLLVLVDEPCDSADQLYQLARGIDWSLHMASRHTFVVDCVGTNQWLRNTQFGALRIKDAVVDHFIDEGERRPSVAKEAPDLRLNVSVTRSRARICLDLSGDALHRRGYRQGTGPAPIKENLAAALVRLSGWSPELPLCDPMCGSGSLLIEAALVAVDQAPGLKRSYWGFNQWLGHRKASWEALVAEAEQRAEQGRADCKSRMWGFDRSVRVLAEAEKNAAAAGVSDLIHFERRDAMDLTPPCSEPGQLISNPPYGERLGEVPELVQLHAALGARLRSQFAHWRVSVLTGSPELLLQLRLRADERHKVFNGRIPCIFANFTLGEARPQDPAQATFELPNGDRLRLSDEAQSFYKRLLKNKKHLQRWAKREGIECYRLYDADIPQFNFAIDLYADHLVLQEYAPPASVPEEKAEQRLLDALLIVPSALGIDAEKLSLKTRRRQRDKAQYEKQAARKETMVVTEYGAKLQVNLYDYLDTGLFLDHRITRRKLGELAQGKRFLNLFSYTGSATVHAALGGARTTTTVDMSRTYLGWAKENMALNGFKNPRQHYFEQANCLEWVKQCDEQFELIFCDPPTFSNSKRMDDTWDVQRDHIGLLGSLKRILAPGGVIIFSNNKRQFKLDKGTLDKMGLEFEDWTKATLPEDFKRNPQIHNCWKLTLNEEQERKTAKEAKEAKEVKGIKEGRENRESSEERGHSKRSRNSDSPW